MDKKTETILDKVAEEWVVGRKKLEERCPEIKENDVEWIQAIKTIVIETNTWIRFLRDEEKEKRKLEYTGSKGKSGNYTSKSGKPTPKMIGWLKHRNVENPEKMSFDEASKKIGELRKEEESNEDDGGWF